MGKFDTTFVGIDPGFTGAIAFLGPQGLTIHDMPTEPDAKGRTVIDFLGLGRALQPDFEGPSLAMLEFVAARPGQGAASVFRFGQGYGAIEMAVAGLGYERHYVTPAVWKKHFKLAKDKGVSRAYACRMFPDHADLFPDHVDLFQRVKDDGRAEAALIALYAKEKFS